MTVRSTRSGVSYSFLPWHTSSLIKDDVSTPSLFSGDGKNGMKAIYRQYDLQQYQLEDELRPP